MDSDKLGNSFRSFSVKNYMKERVYFSCGFAAGKEKKKLKELSGYTLDTNRLVARQPSGRFSLKGTRCF